jgi:NAD(P)H-dependent FMN reductase
VDARIVIRPRLRRAVFAERLGDWLAEGVAGHQGLGGLPDAAAALVVVPEYLRAGARGVLADLAGTDWSGTVVAVVGYGGRTRGRFAVEDAREALDGVGARVLETSLGLDVARIRTEGFDPADVLLRDLVLDRLAEDAAHLRSGGTPARPTPHG